MAQFGPEEQLGAVEAELIQVTDRRQIMHQHHALSDKFMPCKLEMLNVRLDYCLCMCLKD